MAEVFSTKMQPVNFIPSDLPTLSYLQDGTLQKILGITDALSLYDILY